MTSAQQFFEGLDGPASLTFLGLLFAAFLLGVLPAGLAYAFRVRDAKKKIVRHVEALQKVLAERDQLRVELEGVRTDNADLSSRLRELAAQHQRLVAEHDRVRDRADKLAAEQLGTQIEQSEAEQQMKALRDRLATMSAQVQSLRQLSRPRPTPPAGAFDVDTLASLRAAKTRAEGLEHRLKQMIADNEALRRQLAR